MIRVTHQRAKCIGCNACVEVNSCRWRISRTDGKSILIGSSEKKGIYRLEVSEDEQDSLQEAELTCPVKIIKLN